MRDQQLTPRHDFLVQLDEQVAIDAFSIKIIHKSTKNSWFNCFKKSFIEQLTKRTGNYKTFATFVSMLSAVVNRKHGGRNVSDLKVEILTLQDLQKMKDSQAAGDSGNRTENGKVSSSVNACAANDLNKRYFILTYSTEFETTHYPLPLNYAGVDQTQSNHLNEITTYLNASDPETVQDTNSVVSQPHLNSTQISSRGMPPLTIEKDRPSSAISRSRRLSNSNMKELNEPLNTSQQILIEKQALQIKELEEKLKKRANIVRQLKAEVKVLNDEKKLLVLKNKNLTSDLAEYRRGFTRRGSHAESASQGRGRNMSRGLRAPISRDSSPGTTPRNVSSMRRSRSYEKPWKSNSRPVSRSGSVERFGSRPSSARERNQFSSRPRSLTRFERQPMIQRRSASVSSRHSVASSGARSRGSSIGRFDPTAYVEQQQNRRRKAEIRRREKIRTKQQSHGSPASLFRNPGYKSSPPPRPVSRNKVNQGSRNFVQANREKHSGFGNSRLFENSIDIDMADIDARLDSLQHYINDLDD